MLILSRSLLRSSNRCEAGSPGLLRRLGIIRTGEDPEGDDVGDEDIDCNDDEDSDDDEGDARSSDGGQNIGDLLNQLSGLTTLLRLDN